ncbi:MAG: hypothetical protein COC01_10045 [Bacteroidetes bacterium]|nr:MAG: hypothetical protein COC01_10045 [Bacteroidota bacterium]
MLAGNYLIKLSLGALPIEETHGVVTLIEALALVPCGIAMTLMRAKWASTDGDTRYKFSCPQLADTFIRAVRLGVVALWGYLT